MKKKLISMPVMEGIRKIKESSGPEKYKYILRAAILVETILLVYGLVLLAKPEKEYAFSQKELECEHGVYIGDFLGRGVDGYYLDNGVEPPADETGGGKIHRG